MFRHGLTLLRAVSPASDPAVVVLGEGLGGGGQAHRLDQGPEGGRPGLLQLQQGNVVVKRASIVILVHHNPLYLRHMLGTALRQHAEVGTPVARV